VYLTSSRQRPSYRRPIIASPVSNAIDSIPRANARTLQAVPFRNRMRWIGSIRFADIPSFFSSYPRANPGGNSLGVAPKALSSSRRNTAGSSTARVWESSEIGKRMIRCPREARTTVPWAKIHLLSCTINHGRLFISFQQEGHHPKIRDGQMPSGRFAWAAAKGWRSAFRRQATPTP
jgi:hypothetical protein